MDQPLVVYEEERNLLWGVVIIVSTAFGTYLLGDAFAQDTLFRPGLQQFTALLLFVIAFRGIVKVTEPLYRFEMTVDRGLLLIEAYKGDTHIKTMEYRLERFDSLFFRPRTPPGEDEALFDFTSNYYLVYRDSVTGQTNRLINLEGVSFTLKVEDIGEIIRFIVKHNPNIRTDEEQARYLNL